MAILANRVKIRNNFIELGKFTIASIQKFFTVILISIACYLIYFSTPRIVRQAFLESTGKFLSMGNVVYQESMDTTKWLFGRLSYLKNLEAENLKLKSQLAFLENIKQLEENTRLENARLTKLLHVTKIINHDFVTARIVGTAISPFTSSATIQAGASDGVKVDDIVRGSHGLVGRISEVSSNYSTIMLKSDSNSRIPVITSSSKIKGMLAKQGDRLKLIYLPENHNITTGEVVYTSGDGKIYPKGISVAVITKVTNEGVFLESIENINDLEFAVIELKTSMDK